MKRTARLAWGTIAVLAACIYLNNTALLSGPPAGSLQLLAHRGLGQTFSSEGLTAETCTATRIHPPEHGYIENTLASMAAAFRAGAARRASHDRRAVRGLS